MSIAKMASMWRHEEEKCREQQKTDELACETDSYNKADTMHGT